MNQEQLLDRVAELLQTEAKKGPGTLILYNDGDFKIHRAEPPLPLDVVVIGIYDADKIKRGLVPSEWIKISRAVWTVKSLRSNTIKFPGQPAAAGGKPGRKPKPQDEDPKTG